MYAPPEIYYKTHALNMHLTTFVSIPWYLLPTIDNCVTIKQDVGA